MGLKLAHANFVVQGKTGPNAEMVITVVITHKDLLNYCVIMLIKERKCCLDCRVWVGLCFKG